MRRRNGRVVVAGVTLAAAVWGMSSAGETFAAWSDGVVVSTGAKAGSWGLEIPEECGDPDQYTEVVEGTPQDDTIDAGNGKQVVLAGAGDDQVLGGNGKDCLVGGPGSDVLDGGNGKDVLIGGADDDLLLGANGPDTLIGGAGNDACDRQPGLEVTECETYVGEDEPSTSQNGKGGKGQKAGSSDGAAKADQKKGATPATDGGGDPAPAQQPSPAGQPTREQPAPAPSSGPSPGPSQSPPTSASTPGDARAPAPPIDQASAETENTTETTP